MYTALGWLILEDIVLQILETLDIKLKVTFLLLPFWSGVVIVEQGQLACGTMRENFMVNHCQQRPNLPKSSLTRPGLAKMKFIVMWTIYRGNLQIRT